MYKKKKKRKRREIISGMHNDDYCVKLGELC